tara:strand:+ start:104 stop:703 length:600 start_codon:yes stop_codon:yes gene_type:complete
MDFPNKYNLSTDEWDVVLTIPLYFTTGIVYADDISNPEEYAPLWSWIARSASSGNNLENDIAINLQDFMDEGINIWELQNTVREKYDLYNYDENGDIFDVNYKKHGQLISSIIDKFDESIVFSLLVDMKFLSYQVAVSYGVPDDPMSDSEREMWWKLFRYLNRRIDDYIQNDSNDSSEVKTDDTERIVRTKNEGEAGFI